MDSAFCVLGQIKEHKTNSGATWYLASDCAKAVGKSTNNFSRNKTKRKFNGRYYIDQDSFDKVFSSDLRQLPSAATLQTPVKKVSITAHKKYSQMLSLTWNIYLRYLRITGSTICNLPGLKPIEWSKLRKLPPSPKLVTAVILLYLKIVFYDKEDNTLALIREAHTRLPLCFDINIDELYEVYVNAEPVPEEVLTGFTKAWNTDWPIDLEPSSVDLTELFLDRPGHTITLKHNSFEYPII